MKKNKPIVIFLFFTSVCYSQNRDNIWMLGYAFDPNYNRCGIDFSFGLADTFSVQSPTEFFLTNTSICDQNGNLLFYTNGNYIANRNHDTLLNSLNFNSGWLTDSSGAFALPMCEGALIIPIPNDSLRFYILHETSGSPMPYMLPNDTNTYYDFQPFYLSYSIVDMSLDGSLGGIDALNINIHAIDDTLSFGRITACKHANGRV